MAYEKQLWNDRQVEKPLTFTMTNNDDGTVTLTPAPGKVTNEGDPMSAERLNHMEDGIAQVNDIPEALTVQHYSETLSGVSGATVTVDFTGYGELVKIRVTAEIEKDGALSVFKKIENIPDWAQISNTTDYVVLCSSFNSTGSGSSSSIQGYTLNNVLNFSFSYRPTNNAYTLAGVGAGSNSDSVTLIAEGIYFKS